MSVGHRIVYGDKRGTIRYVGQVPPFVGIWFGVDWDSPEDGKHNGTYKGIQYFHTTYPKSGSFVKSTEVDFGLKFVDALKEQYDYDVTKAKKEYEESMKDFAVSVYDFVNLEKVKRLQGPLSELQIVNLASYNISSPGEDDEILHTCPNIIDLDLSNNLMTSWESIALIAKQLKNLKSLTLSDTRLTLPEEPEKLKSSFNKLQNLFLCRTLYTWRDIHTIAMLCPHLENFKIPFSRINTLDTPQEVLQNIKHLDFQGNGIGQWSEINKLGHLPHLEVLNICNTGITEITIPAQERLFQRLHTLYASENNIKNFVDIIDLNNLPLLKDLRINKNPFTSDKFLSHREKIIARIGNLKILNGREISTDERRNAEYEYLRDFAKDWSYCFNTEEKIKFLMEHPRYESLIKKHGPVEVPPEIDPSLKGHLISVTLTYVNDDCTQKIIKKRVHLSLAIYKLITIAKRVFNINAEKLNLVRVSSKNPAIKVDMPDHLKAVNSYAVEDGDIIFITH